MFAAFPYFNVSSEPRNTIWVTVSMTSNTNSRPNSNCTNAIFKSDTHTVIISKSDSISGSAKDVADDVVSGNDNRVDGICSNSSSLRSSSSSEKEI